MEKSNSQQQNDSQLIIPFEEIVACSRKSRLNKCEKFYSYVKFKILRKIEDVLTLNKQWKTEISFQDVKKKQLYEKCDCNHSYTDLIWAIKQVCYNTFKIQELRFNLKQKCLYIGNDIDCTFWQGFEDQQEQKMSFNPMVVYNNIIKRKRQKLRGDNNIKEDKEDKEDKEETKDLPKQIEKPQRVIEDDFEQDLIEEDKLQDQQQNEHLDDMLYNMKKKQSGTNTKDCRKRCQYLQQLLKTKMIWFYRLQYLRKQPDFDKENIQKPEFPTRVCNKKHYREDVVANMKIVIKQLNHQFNKLFEQPNVYEVYCNQEMDDQLYEKIMKIELEMKDKLTEEKINNFMKQDNMGKKRICTKDDQCKYLQQLAYNYLFGTKITEVCDCVHKAAIFTKLINKYKGLNYLDF